MRKNKFDIISILEETEALSEGHFELPDGGHVQNYIDTFACMQYPSIASKIAKALSCLFEKNIDAVFAASAENSVLAQEVAKVKKARAVYAVIEDNGTMRLKDGMFIKSGENILIVDNVTVTGRRVGKAAGLVKMLNANAIGIAVIIDRAECGAIGNIPLRSLLSYPLDVYAPGDCPMCKSGAKLIKKGGKK